jgi:arylsulfatase A-like enzyme
MRAEFAMVPHLVARLCCAALLVSTQLATASDAAPARHRVVIFVWDGLRPDAVDGATTPNLAAFGTTGVRFAHHRSVYPTQTMINAAALATGNYPSRHGFYGNWLWQPAASGANAKGQPVDFRQPVFSEDYAVLDALDSEAGQQLLRSTTLVERAVRSGLDVAVIGKSGPVYLQDRHRLATVLDEKSAFPLGVAKALSDRGFGVPLLTPNAYPGQTPGKSPVADPTRFAPIVRLQDEKTPDPASATTTAYAGSNAYFMHVLSDYIWPVQQPDLTIVWLRDPDTTEHDYGPGTAPYRDGLRDMDGHFGALLARLDALGWRNSTDVLVLSDHGHSSVAGDPREFPLRSLTDGHVGAIDGAGYSVSGNVRTADLLTDEGFTAADGLGPLCNPVLSGIRRDGSPVVPRNTGSQTSCPGGEAPARLVPSVWPRGSHPVVIAPNGGSEYFYVPDHDTATVRRLVSVLLRHPEYGPIFVDGERYPDLPGTLRLADVRLDGQSAMRPDLVVSLSYDPDAVVQGVAGTEYSSTFPSVTRGMHGSLSPRDINAVLIAAGPDFRPKFVSDIPSATVDVAATAAWLLGIPLIPTDGRVLIEALAFTGAQPTISVTTRTLRSRSPAVVAAPLPGQAAGGLRPDSLSSVEALLQIDTVHVGHRRYDYLRGGVVERRALSARRKE